MVRASRASRPSAPGASASSPRCACRRSPSGTSSPWACGARSSASAGAPVKPFRRASALMRWISPTTVSSVAAISWCICVGLVPLDEVRRVAVAAEELLQLLVADPGEDAGIGDLVAVQVQDRQDHAVGHRVQELVGVPARRQRPGLRLAVADDAGDDQVRGCRTRRRRRARARSRARRPRGSSRASPAPRGSECRPGTRTG